MWGLAEPELPPDDPGIELPAPPPDDELPDSTLPDEDPLPEAYPRDQSDDNASSGHAEQTSDIASTGRANGKGGEGSASDRAASSHC